MIGINNGSPHLAPVSRISAKTHLLLTRLSEHAIRYLDPELADRDEHPVGQAGRLHPQPARRPGGRSARLRHRQAARCAAFQAAGQAGPGPADGWHRPDQAAGPGRHPGSGLDAGRQDRSLVRTARLPRIRRRVARPAAGIRHAGRPRPVPAQGVRRGPGADRRRAPGATGEQRRAARRTASASNTRTAWGGSPSGWSSSSASRWRWGSSRSRPTCSTTSSPSS